MNEHVVATIAALVFLMGAGPPLAWAQEFVIKPVAEKKVQQLPPGEGSRSLAAIPIRANSRASKRAWTRPRRPSPGPSGRSCRC